MIGIVNSWKRNGLAILVNCFSEIETQNNENNILILKIICIWII